MSRYKEWYERLAARDPDDLVCELDLTTEDIMTRFNKEVLEYLHREVGPENDQVYDEEDLS